MSEGTASETPSADKPLLTLLNAPAVEPEDEAGPASQCCGGGSCSL